MANSDYEEERYCEANCPVLVGRSISTAELATVVDAPVLPSYHGMHIAIHIPIYFFMH